MRVSLRTCARTISTICVIGLLLTTVLAPAAAMAAGGQASQPEADNTVTRIHVYPDGSAQWTIQIRTRLDTDDRVAEYEAFQARFRENTSKYLDPFRERMRGVVANAANATGREMRAVNFTASTTIQQVPRRWGIVTYRFTWTEFAAPQNETLVVGDVFQGGFFLAVNDTLVLEAPEGYEITGVEPVPASREDGAVTWIGREDFADRHPRVVFTPTADGGTPTDAPQSDSDSTPDGAATAPFGDIGPGVVLGGVLLLALISIGVATIWRWRDDTRDTDHAGRPSPTGNTADGAQAPTGEDEAGDEPATGAAVMTDRERVQTLLEANGGRMRQTVIADEFDWPAWKASRVIGNMVDDGTIEKLKLGRENLIDLVETEE